MPQFFILNPLLTYVIARSVHALYSISNVFFIAARPKQFEFHPVVSIFKLESECITSELTCGSITVHSSRMWWLYKIIPVSCISHARTIVPLNYNKILFNVKTGNRAVILCLFIYLFINIIYLSNYLFISINIYVNST